VYRGYGDMTQIEVRDKERRRAEEWE
jgi:hypothetical protein